MGSCLPGQQAAGKLLGPLLSEMPALTRQLGVVSGLPYWGRGETEGGARGRRLLPETNFNSTGIYKKDNTVHTSGSYLLQLLLTSVHAQRRRRRMKALGTLLKN